MAFVSVFWKFFAISFNLQTTKTTDETKYAFASQANRILHKLPISRVRFRQKWTWGWTFPRAIAHWPLGTEKQFEGTFFWLPSINIYLSACEGVLSILSNVIIIYLSEYSLWGLAWDYQGHVTLPCCTLAFTVFPRCRTSPMYGPCVERILCQRQVVAWRSSSCHPPCGGHKHIFVAWLYHLFMSPLVHFLCLMTGRVVTNVPRLLLWEAGDMISDHAGMREGRFHCFGRFEWGIWAFFFYLFQRFMHLRVCKKMYFAHDSVIHKFVKYPRYRDQTWQWRNKCIWMANLIVICFEGVIFCVFSRHSNTPLWCLLVPPPTRYCTSNKLDLASE